MSAAAPAPIPVTVVTGFLGAGKTTLVNRFLEGIPRGDVAVIVNEHGEVGIDGAILAARVKTLVEIAGGCLCCSTQAELAAALDQLAASPSPPKRILIETSGAASPAGVLRVISGRDAVFLDGILTVVDASRLHRLTEHELATEQVGYADVVVLSRADACTEEQQQQALDTIATSNGAAIAMLATREAFLDASLATLDELLARRSTDFTHARLVSPQASHADHVYESIALAHDGELDGERFAHFMEEELARFAGRLLRTKGIIALAGVDDRMIVQGVADLVEVTFGEPWSDGPRTSRFVIVGFGLDRDSLTQAFAACAV